MSSVGAQSFVKRYAASAVRAAGVETVLWLHADRFAEPAPPPGARALVERLTGPLGGEGVRSVLCFEGAPFEGWLGGPACPSGARVVHLARYGSPLDVAGAERADRAVDLEHVRALVADVAAGEGADPEGLFGEGEARSLLEGSGGCARVLIAWTQRTVREAGRRALRWADFERRAPPVEQREALVRCAVAAEETVRAMLASRSAG